MSKAAGKSRSVQTETLKGRVGRGLFTLYWYECPLVGFSLRDALCVPSAVNTQGFVW